MLGDAHFHHYCYAGLPRRGGRSITCPSCAVSFDEVKPNYIGEKAVSRAEDDYRGNKKQKRGRPSRAAEEDEEEDEDDEDELEEGEEEQPRRRSHGGSQVTRAGAGPVSRSPLSLSRAYEQSRWVASGTSRRDGPSYVPETQFDDE